MSSTANEKENKQNMTHTLDTNLIEIGLNIFDLILDNKLLYMQHLVKTEQDVRDCLLLYENEEGQNAYEYSKTNKRYKIAEYLLSNVYNSQKKMQKYVNWLKYVR